MIDFILSFRKVRGYSDVSHTDCIKRPGQDPLIESPQSLETSEWRITDSADCTERQWNYLCEQFKQNQNKRAEVNVVLGKSQRVISITREQVKVILLLSAIYKRMFYMMRKKVAPWHNKNVRLTIFISFILFYNHMSNRFYLLFITKKPLPKR